MKNSIILLISLIAIVRCPSILFGTTIAIEGAVYNLEDIAKEWSINISDNEVLCFSICRTLDSCYSTFPYTFGKIKVNNKCQESLTKNGEPAYSRVKLGNNDTLAINYTHIGMKCKTSNEYYSLTIYLTCDPSISKETAIPTLLNSDSPCSYSILLPVKNGCPIVDWSKFWEIATFFWPLGAVLLIAAGALFGIFGKAMWNKILFIVFAATFISIFCALSYSALPIDAPIWVYCLVEVLSIGIGIASAYYTVKNQVVGIILLGFWMGTSFTILLQDFIVRALVLMFLLYKMDSL